MLPVLNYSENQTLKLIAPELTSREIPYNTYTSESTAENHIQLCCVWRVASASHNHIWKKNVPLL